MSATRISVGDPTSHAPTMGAGFCSLLVGATLIVALILLLLPSRAPAAVSPSQQWMTSAGPNTDSAGDTMNITFGATGVTGLLTAVSNDSVFTGFVNYPEAYPLPITDPTIPNAAAFIEPDAPADAATIATGVAYDPGTTAVTTFSFNKPVIAPFVHVNNLDASYLDITGTTTTGAPITLSAVSKNAILEVVGNRLNATPHQPIGAGCQPDGQMTAANGGCGSVRLQSGLVKDFTFTNVHGPDQGAPGDPGNGDGWLYALSFPTAPLTKNFSPARIPVGGTSQLTFTITNPNNPGQADLFPLDFTDRLPANVTLADGNVANNGSCGTPSVTDSGGGGLSAGDTGVAASNISVVVGATCTITINVTSSTVGNYVNDNNNLSTAVANLIPNASTPLEVYPVADLEIDKTTSGPVVPGEEATYELLVTNRGPSTATNEVVSDPLPSGLSFVSASPGCSEAGGTVTCSIASLAANTSTTFTVTARAAASAECEDLANTATVSGNTSDPDMSNNTSTVRNCERRADRSLTKDPSSAQVASGGQVMYTLVVRNNGPSDDSNVMVTDPTSAGLSLVSADPSQGSCSTEGGRVSCDLGDLRAGGSAQILVTATVTALAGASCSANTITNTATVSGDAFDPNPDNNQDSAQICVPPGPPPPPPPPFDLVVSKTANDRSVLIGQRVTYRVTVRNNGPGAAPDARVTDTLNAPVTVVSVRATQGSCERRIPMSCELGTIAAGQSVTITIVAKHREAVCRQRNAASATGAGTDVNPANNLDTVDVCVKKVRLKLSKVASREVVRGGQTFNYRIRVRNPTKGEARNVKVCDRLPSGLRYVSSKPRAKVNGRRQCWTIKRLKARKSRTFKVTVRAANGAIGRRTNRATATSPDIRRVTDRDPVRILGRATPVTG
jgi:uncharacterized repeat protein (TIGR01451 family)